MPTPRGKNSETKKKEKEKEMGKAKREEGREDNPKEASTLLRWMRNGGSRRESSVKEEKEDKESIDKVDKKEEEGLEKEVVDKRVGRRRGSGKGGAQQQQKGEGKGKRKGKRVGRKRGERDEEEEKEEEEEELESSEEGEEEEEWKPQKKEIPVRKGRGRKLKTEEEEEEEEEEENNDENEEKPKKDIKDEEEALNPKKTTVPTRLKEATKPKKEESDVNDTQNQEDAEGGDEENQDAEEGTEDADFNEYERQRQENILKNKLLLQQLQLDSASLGLKSKARPKSTSKSTPRKKQESKPSATEHVPRRQSSRLAGLPADSEKAKRRYEEQTAALEQAERTKRMRVSGDVKFDVGGIDFNLKGERYARTFTDEDVQNTDNIDVKRLREKMMGLKLYERWVPNDIKITPERVYYLGFHPTADKQLIFAGDKFGSLGIWDASSSKPNPDAEEDDDEKELPAISQFKIHPSTISSFVFSPFSMNTILTASYDSSIRSFDLSKGVSSELFVGEDEEGISGVELHEDNPYLIYFSTLEGRMGRKDTRFAGKADVWQLSNKKIGGFSMHPKHTHLCVTASLDRTMKIWDLRKIVGGGIFGSHKNDDEDTGPKPMLIGEHPSSLSVSSAYWNRNGSIATASYDNTVKIYQFPNAGDWAPGVKIPGAGANQAGEVKPSKVIPHNNECGRWVTILRAQWQQNPRDGADKLVIGNMKRFLDIYAEDGTQLAQLGHEYLSAVPAAAQFHPTENWVAGGTASGKVGLFL